MIISRDKYLRQLVAAKSNGMVKIVTGIRRSGKSFLLMTLFHQHLIEQGVQESHIIYNRHTVCRAKIRKNKKNVPY